MLAVFRDEEGGVGAIAFEPDTVGDAFRKLAADIDVGGLATESMSSGNNIGCKMLPDVDGPLDDFESIAEAALPGYPLLSHDKVRRRGTL